MNLLYIILVTVCIVLPSSRVRGACFTTQSESDERICVPNQSVKNMESCLTCTCSADGLSNSCCDVSYYPVIIDNTRCRKVRVNCEWIVVPKVPQWRKDCIRGVGLFDLVG